MPRLAAALLLFSLAWLLATPPAAAQDAPTPGLTSPLENPNRFARPGMPTNEVWVWGEVSQPGIWRVERGADLVQFLSHLRVPGLLQQQSQTRTRFTLKIYRGESQSRELIYEIRLDELLEEGGEYPQLQDGDILAVELRQRQSRLQIARLVTGVVSSAASLTLLFLRLRDGRF
ncbi:MAG: hypothetical protein GVY12_14310 [Bacteroidetes bacterium]|jgi:hypothetical protein|nr:hypothetical protein [Bacteroidota bacterium]